MPCRKSENPAWRLSFVVTNPPWHERLEENDKVYVLRERGGPLDLLGLRGIAQPLLGPWMACMIIAIAGELAGRSVPKKQCLLRICSTA